MPKARIMVVEDENLTAMSIQRRLEILGYDVPAVVSSGEEAVLNAKLLRPDLVLMDIVLQGDMDGIVAAERIRLMLDIPIIYTSIHADNSTMQRAKLTQPFGYIMKPFNERELRLTIEMALYNHKLERRLKESKQQLSTTLRSIGDAVISTDTLGCVTLMNAVAESLTGWSENEALGVDLADVFHLKEDGGVGSVCTSEPQRSVICRSDGLLISRDGSSHPVDYSLSYIRGDTAEVGGMVVVFRDITDRRTAEETLRRRDAILAAVHLASQNILSSSSWERGISRVLIELCTAACVSHTYIFENGILNGEVVASLRYEGTAPSVNRTTQSYVMQNLSYKQRGYGRWLEILAADGVVGGNVREFPACEQFPAKMGFQCILVVPIFVEDRWWGFMGLGDCTAERSWCNAEIDALRTAATILGAAIHHRKSDQELYKAEAIFRILTEKIPAICYIASFQDDLKIQYVSPQIEEYLGLSPMECISDPGRWVSILHPSDRDRVLRELKESWEGHGAFKSEYRLYDISGKIRWFYDWATIIRDEEGKPVCLHGVSMDVTQSKVMQEELLEAKAELERRVQERTESLIEINEALSQEIAFRKAIEEDLSRARDDLERRVRDRTEELQKKNAEMERFVYSVSHDLRAPLVTISGFLDILDKDLAERDIVRINSDMRAIEVAVTKMDLLIRDTLELSRAGSVARPKDGVSFSHVVEEALGQVAGKLRSGHISISISSSLPSVRADRSKLVEVMVNLLENSIKYMGSQPSPKVEIFCIRQGGEDVFCIRDNGIGIDPSQHLKVFDLFYKVDKSSEGTGAGLAIVKRIIEVHGGRIWIESASGRGCTVCFTLQASSMA